MPDRRLLRLRGADTRAFLQDLVTNDVTRLDAGLVYAALLTPQGKYLADFFLVPDGDAVLIDVAAALGDTVAQRLAMYRLRRKIDIEEAPLHLHRGTGAVPDDGFADPRDPALGWRAYRAAPQTEDATDWDALRVAHIIPETGIELTPETYILEAGFERLSGVDFRKGCYVGQEVTARMKHKTELRKGLTRVKVTGDAAPGTEITRDGKAVGTLYTRAGDAALAHLRFDRAEGELRAGDAAVDWTGSRT